MKKNNLKELEEKSAMSNDAIQKLSNAYEEVNRFLDKFVMFTYDDENYELCFEGKKEFDDDINRVLDDDLSAAIDCVYSIAKKRTDSALSATIDVPHVSNCLPQIDLPNKIKKEVVSTVLNIKNAKQFIDTKSQSYAVLKVFECVFDYLCYYAFNNCELKDIIIRDALCKILYNYATSLENDIDDLEERRTEYKDTTKSLHHFVEYAVEMTDEIIDF